MGNSLPWTDAIETQLLSMGVSCIEHLKECRIDEWNELFCCEPLIIKRVATRVFESFKLEGAFDPKKCASQLGMAQSVHVVPLSASLNKIGYVMDDGTTQKLSDTPWKNFTITQVKNGTNRKKRLKIRAESRAAVAALMHSTNDNCEDDGKEGTADDETLAAAAEDTPVVDEVDQQDTEVELEVDGAWRTKRCVLSTDLSDPASAEERSTWDRDLVTVMQQCDNIEDPCGYYAALGCSKVSSDLDIGKAYSSHKKRYRRAALAGHPDKSKDKKKNAKYERATSKFNFVKKAHEVIGMPNDDGCYPGRVEYDKDGQERRDKMEDVSFVYLSY